MRFVKARTTVLPYIGPATAANNATDKPTLPLISDGAVNFHFLIALRNVLTGGSDIGPVLGAAKAPFRRPPASHNAQFHKLGRAAAFEPCLSVAILVGGVWEDCHNASLSSHGRQSLPDVGRSRGC